jgi:hypothetical protein
MSDENYALLGCYAACIGYFLPTFRDNLSVPSSWVKNPKKVFGFLTLEYRTDRLSRNVVKNNHYSLHNNPEERSSYIRRGGSLKSRNINYIGRNTSNARRINLAMNNAPCATETIYVIIIIWIIIAIIIIRPKISRSFGCSPALSLALPLSTKSQ